MTDEEMAELYANKYGFGSDFNNMTPQEHLEHAKDYALKQVVKSLSTETLLKELIDRKVIRSWYYNGTYHVGNELPKGE